MLCHTYIEHATFNKFPTTLTSFITFTVPCAEGTYFDTNTDTCQLCPKGSYQSLEAQSMCQVCEEGTTTNDLGTATHANCDGKYLAVY